MRALEVCYRCGLSFREKHMHTEAHLCLAFAEQREKRSEAFFLGLELCVFAVVAGSICFLTHVVALA